MHSDGAEHCERLRLRSLETLTLGGGAGGGGKGEKDLMPWALRWQRITGAPRKDLMLCSWTSGGANKDLQDLGITTGW